MTTEALIDEARRRIGAKLEPTPCRRAPDLEAVTGGTVHLKLENLQRSGSFKIRGVLNTVLSLAGDETGRRLFAASTGNHGAAFAEVAEELGYDGTLYMPSTAAGFKVERLRPRAIDLEMHGDDCVEAELAAAAAAREAAGVWISPYNHPAVVAGQGTVAVELVEQLEEVDDVLVPVGGGGLISGIAVYLKAVRPSVRVIGCQPRNSCVMQRSIEAGRIVDDTGLETLSDATAGGIEPGSITFDICRRLVDEFVLLDEPEIVSAMHLLHRSLDLQVEGGAAMPVAAILQQPERYAGRSAVAIISGGAIDPSFFDQGDSR
jgi:threonine dehydratase